MKLLILPFLIYMSAYGEPLSWKAKKSIELSSSEIAIDGGSPSSLKCPHKTKQVQGTLEIQSIALELSCYDDYMGGFYFKDFILAQQEGDAGDTWETQSLLFFDITSKSVILSLKYYSTYDTSIECDGATKEDLKKSGWDEQKIKDCLAGVVKCKTSEKFKKWNPKSQEFIDTSFKGEVPKRQFKPFKGYLKNCK